MSIVYVAPYVPPPPPAPPFTGTRNTLTGFDGRVWDLSSSGDGVFLTNEGIRGLGRPQWTIHSSTSPVVHGARYHGHVAPAREVHLPLFLYHNGSSGEWGELYRAFMSIMRPDAPIQWTITHLDTSESRSLMMRFLDAGDDVIERNPRWLGWKSLGLNFVADERPFWEGQAVSRSWTNSVPVPFFDPPGDDPRDLYALSAGLTLAGARVTNNGDEDAWPIWDVTGPITSVTVGVGGRVVTAPIPLVEGESLRIDTRPGHKSAYDGVGQRRTPELTARQWAPIPPGETVPLSLSMDGTGTVTVSFTPLHHEAY